MNTSILNEIKKLLGIPSSYTAFDSDLIIDINSALATITQLGIGDDEGFMITDSTATWEDFIGDDLPYLAFIKTYVHLSVKIVFDPPQSSSTLQAMQERLDELTFRLNVEQE